MTLERLPLTPNGKVDYRALPAPVISRPACDANATLPRGPVGEKLAAVWGEVLHRETVDIHDNFFDLGGHSLTATVLAMRIGSAFHVDFPLREIFEKPVFAEIAAVIERLAPRIGKQRHGCMPIQRTRTRLFRSRTCSRRMSPGRSEGFDLGNIALHAYIEFEPERFDLGRANAALRTLIARHPMLRAVVRGDGTQQVLEQVPGYTIELVDLKGRPAERNRIRFRRRTRTTLAPGFRSWRVAMV